LLAGISVSLSKGGYDLNISIAPNSEHEIDSLRHMVQGKRVDGIILTLTKAVDELISYLLDQNFFCFVWKKRGTVHRMLFWTWMESLHFEKPAHL
jgi:DNA-binding LacI/PurR family transcriptional regulator